MKIPGKVVIIRTDFNLCFFFSLQLLTLTNDEKSISLIGISRRSHLEVFCKKDALIIFTKFTGKHLRQSLFFNKVAAYNFNKKETFG